MTIFVTIIRVAFFADWTCSLISMQWCFVCAGTLGSAVHSLLSAEERVSRYFLMLLLGFNTNYFIYFIYLIEHLYSAPSR